MASMIDRAAREAAAAQPSFGENLRRALPLLVAADLGTTVTTLQGPIRLSDYLVTRCVEAVIHGCDLVAPVDPDAKALVVTADALTSVLASRHSELLALVHALPVRTWIDAATGRCKPPPGLEGALPVMA